MNYIVKPLKTIPLHDIAFIFAGFFVGTVVGLTGVGGGSLMTPILIFVFDIKPYMAVGTDLLFAAFTKMGGTLKMARTGLVPWRVVLHLSAGSTSTCGHFWHRGRRL